MKPLPVLIVFGVMAAIAVAAQPHTFQGPYQPISGKGVANGYASLDGTGKVPPAQLPAGSPSAWGTITGTLSDQTDLQTALDGKEASGAFSGIGACAANQWASTLNDTAAPTCTQPGFTNLSGTASDAQVPAAIARDAEVTSEIATHAGAADPHTGYQKESEKDAANGYAGLSAGSKIAGTQQTYGAGANTAAEGNDARLSDARTPLAHKTSHENAGSDEISVAGLSGLLADGQTPLAHATSHQSGGSDPIKLDDLATPDDNTDLNASTLRHGLLLKLTGSASNFLRADGTWAAPTASVAISVAEIDFGTDAKFVAVATITDAGISATSKIIITQAGIAATGRQADENEMDGITCNAFPATGTFTLRCHTAGQTPTHGKFNVWYTAS